MMASTSRSEFRRAGAAALVFIACAAAAAPTRAAPLAPGVLVIVNEIDTDSIKAFCEGKRQKFEAPPIICPLFNKPPFQSAPF